jgi:hypothetical protein
MVQEVVCCQLLVVGGQVGCWSSVVGGQFVSLFTRSSVEEALIRDWMFLFPLSVADN